jgi:Flp pilus assembly protein TadG
MLLDKGRNRARRGQGVVELALTLPIVLLLLSGMIDFGRLFYSWLVVTHCAHTGARYAAVGYGEYDVVTRATATAGSIPVTVTVTGAQGAGGSPVTVNVTNSFRLLTPLATLFSAEAFPVTATATMRIEGVVVL